MLIGALVGGLPGETVGLRGTLVIAAPCGCGCARGHRGARTGSPTVGTKVEASLPAHLEACPPWRESKE